jgi:hypothetical protein
MIDRIANSPKPSPMSTSTVVNTDIATNSPIFNITYASNRSARRCRRKYSPYASRKIAKPSIPRSIA